METTTITSPKSDGAVYDRTLLAPNGKPTNLCTDDYHLVRSPEFIARFGDWTKGEGRCLLDANGEPQAFYHGTNWDFERFDPSRLGENSGGTYTMPSGEQLPQDSEKAFFFTSSRSAAVSYAFLSQHLLLSRHRAAVEGLICPIEEGKILFGPKTREEFLAATAAATLYVPQLAQLRSAIRTFPERKILSDLIPSTFTPDERGRIAGMLKLTRSNLNEEADRMYNGALANQFLNLTVQQAYVLSLSVRTERLRKNDPSLCNPLGSFGEYDYIVCGPANMFATFTRTNGRMGLIRNGKTVFFDECTEQDMTRLMNEVLEMTHRAIQDFNSESGTYISTARIYRCFLETANPFEHDYEYSPFPDKYKDHNYSTGAVAARQVRKALLDGNDSVVYRNIRDPFAQDTVGVFSADQILIAGIERGAKIPLRYQAKEITPTERYVVLNYAKFPGKKEKIMPATVKGKGCSH